MSAYTTDTNFKVAFDKLTPVEQTTLRTKSPELFADPVQRTPTPAATPVTTPVRSPDVYQQALDDAATTAASRDEIVRKNQTYAAQQRQLRIDAINQAFAPRIQRESKAGADRLSRVAALNFKAGIVGSGVDTTKTGEQTQLNDKALQAIEDEKATAIQEAFGYADKLATDLSNSEYEAATKTADEKVVAAKNRLDTSLNVLKTFGASGKIKSAKDLMDVDPAAFNALKTASGMTDNEIDTYLKVNAPQGTYQWNAAQVKGSTMYVPTIKNGKPSIESLDLGFTPDKAVKSTVETDQGVLLIYEDGTTKNISAPKNQAGFTLQPGETRYDAKGNPIATAPGTGDYTNDLNDAVAFIKANPRVDKTAMKQVFLTAHPGKNKEWTDFIGE